MIFYSLHISIEDYPLLSSLHEVLSGSAGLAGPAPGQGVVGGRLRSVEILEHLPVVGLPQSRGTCTGYLYNNVPVGVTVQLTAL